MQKPAPSTTANPPSRRVTSSQRGVHSNLDRVVLRNQLAHFQRPIAEHNQRAFDEAMTHWHGQPLILDAGCGNGHSSRQIAANFPDHLVLAVDKSAQRLDKHAHLQQSDNLLLLRADLMDFYRLLDQQSLQLARQYILYPNPWPKAGHLQRRWHGSAIMQCIVRLGGRLEMRSNWQVYLDEFARALGHYDRRAEVTALTFADTQAEPRYITDFEAKYHRSGHSLWQLHCDLDQQQAAPDSN